MLKGKTIIYVNNIRIQPFKGQNYYHNYHYYFMFCHIVTCGTQTVPLIQPSFTKLHTQKYRFP